MEILGYELSPMYLAIVTLVVLGAIWWWMNREKFQKRAVERPEMEEQPKEETESQDESMSRDSQSQYMDPNAQATMMRGGAPSGMLPGYGQCQQ